MTFYDDDEEEDGVAGGGNTKKQIPASPPPRHFVLRTCHGATINHGELLTMNSGRRRRRQNPK